MYHFCLALPYSYNRLQTFLGAMEKKAAQLNESFTRESLTNSVVGSYSSNIKNSSLFLFQQKRNLDLLTIGSFSEELKTRRLIAIMARVHPGESAGSLVCQGKDCKSWLSISKYLS